MDGCVDDQDYNDGAQNDHPIGNLNARSVEQLAADLKDLAAKQEQIAHDTATLQAVERDLRQNISSVPPPGAVQIPRPKPTQPSAQSLATH